MLAVVIVLFLLSIFLYGFYRVWYASNYPKRSVKGKTVLITGAGRGLGRLQADRFAKLGANLILWDINAENLEKTKEELAAVTNVATAIVDVSKSESVFEAARQAGPVDYLINNAGIAHVKSTLELTERDVNVLVSINALSHFTAIKAFLPGMVERKFGHITCISSAAGHVGVGWLSDYCAAKHALIGLMEALRFEIQVQQYPITTATICPLFVNTPLLEGAPEGSLTGSVLAPDAVADRIVEATVRGEEMVLIPESLGLIVPLIRLLPCKLQMRLLGPTAFGVLTRLV
jgi:all-trans-retinol dehydrogenase (NAD+)